MKEIIITNFIKVHQSVLSLVNEKAILKPLDEHGMYSDKYLVSYERLIMRFERALEIICNIFFRAVEMAEFGSLSDDTQSCIAKMKDLSLIVSEELWMEMIKNRTGVTPALLPEIRINLCNKILFHYIDELSEFCRRVEKRYPVHRPLS